jgi:hypothetical protein
MLRTKSLYLKSIRGLEPRSDKELLLLLSSRFMPELGFGFSDIEDLGTKINSTLIYQTVVNRNVYNPDDDDFVAHEDYIYSQVPFSIDKKNGFLHVYVGGEKLQRLIGVLSQIFNYEVEVDDVFVNIYSLITEIKKSNLEYSILGITVNNFQPDLGVSGRFVAAVENQDIAQHIIQSYTSDVREIIIRFYDETDILWKITNKGKIAVRSDEDTLNDQVELLKATILRCQDA